MYNFEKNNSPPVGIVCELSPPHEGHFALFRRARENFPGSAVVLAMSPSFTQRGEPAVYPKAVRAAIAVENGADLALELPTRAVLQSAERFAAAGVRLLSAAGCGTVAFGSECGEITPLTRVADAMDDARFDDLTRENLRSGLSYANARQIALDAILGEEAELLASPNNLLGAYYIRAARKLGLSCVTFARTAGVSSAAVRDALRKGPSLLAAACPPPMFRENLEIAVLSRLRAMSLDDFSALQGASDGVAERVFAAARSSSTLAELEAAAKTKRHALARLRRFIMCAALGLRGGAETPQYLRPLAMNEHGRNVLKDAKNRGELVISKPADFKAELADEAAATDFYVLGYAYAALRRAGEEWRTSPVFIGEKYKGEVQL